MKKLGDLILPDSLLWTDLWDWSPVAMETARTLGGAPVVWSQPLLRGRPVTLEAQEEVTWLNRATVDAIRAMAAQSGASFILIWELEAHTVMFRHNDPPAVTFEPLWPHHDLFTATLKLMTV